MLAPVPTPIGVGPEFRPQPGLHAPCARAGLLDGKRMHVELFARGRVIVMPAAIGVEAPRIIAGRVMRARCRARIWTLDPTGVVRFAGRASLGDLFRVWGRRLTAHALLGFRGALRIYRNGGRVRAGPRGLALRDRDELVLEVGPFVRPHRSYRFPRH